MPEGILLVAQVENSSLRPLLQENNPQRDFFFIVVGANWPGINTA